ncbi:MAG TPA: TylF/MycF family methyltransferase [Mycobacteriales bacterium]|nr:TylF/MycF family methyltransferase [Mycobacteriales bacterium]
MTSSERRPPDVGLAPGPAAASLYLELLKGALTRLWFDDGHIARADEPAGRSRRFGRASGPVYSARSGYDREQREVGLDWPASAETMIGIKRLNALQACVETVLADDVPGDLVETGVWRGGASILMKGVLAAYGDESRQVWCCDSFQGLPPPDPERYPADAGDTHHGASAALAVTREQVSNNFARYQLLDDRVRFLEGWFKDTLPEAPIDRVAVLRLDGDMYESTIQALDALYDRLSPGGFVVVDDYALAGCREAITDFRAAHGIDDEIVEDDWTGVHWRRSG